MLIGENFNNRAKQLLLTLAELSDHDPDEKVEVEALAKELSLDRSELKNLLEYLENKEFITIATIGGPFLYGHLHITEEGIEKAASLK